MTSYRILLFIVIVGASLIVKSALATTYEVRIRPVGSSDVTIARCVMTNQTCRALVKFTMLPDLQGSQTKANANIDVGIEINKEQVSMLFLKEGVPITTNSRENRSFAIPLEDIEGKPEVLTLYTINPASLGDHDYAVIRPANQVVGKIVFEVTRQPE